MTVYKLSRKFQTRYIQRPILPQVGGMNMIQQSGKNWKRSYWYLFATQFQESFSDNAYKFLLTSFVIAMGLSEDQRATYVSAILVLFSLPFILFSMSGGYLADRFS